MLTTEKVERMVKLAQLLLLGFALISILKAEGGGGDPIDTITPI